MSLSATYSSATQFTVAADKTSDFAPGRAVRCDCGADGIKYGYVSYSSYSAPNTTVYLDSTESQAITNNLSTVDFSRVLGKETGGNLPLQVVWMNRGFKSGLTLSYKDADEIYINSGALHIDNGSAENIYCAQSQITKQLTSLSASTWYAIYVDPPDNGLSLVADDIEYSTTMPTYDQAKRGWYHGTNTDWRCIGFVYSNGSSQIEPFSVESGLYQMNAIQDQAWSDGNVNTSLDVTISRVPIGGLVCALTIEGAYKASQTWIYVTEKGSTRKIPVSEVKATVSTQTTCVLCRCDASRKITVSATLQAACIVWSQGFMMPDGM
jgi:hypothetical protein